MALFWLRFPEASVHSHLSVCPWAFPWSMEASLWQKCVEEETVCVMASRNQTEKGTRHNLTGHTPNDLLTPARPYFLKLPKAPKIAPAVGDQTFSRHTCGSQFIFEPQQLRGTPTASPSTTLHTCPSFKDNLSGWYAALQRECKLPPESSEVSVETIWRHDKEEDSMARSWTAHKGTPALHCTVSASLF